MPGRSGQQRSRGGVAQHHPVHPAGGPHPGRPERQGPQRLVGGTWVGSRTPASMRSASPASAPITLDHRGPSRPRVAAVAATSRCRIADSRRVSGCPTGAGAWANANPSRARSTARKAGEAIAIGCAVEQMSWRNPGRVTSSVLNPPPGVSAASRTRTRHPASARPTAANRPLGPEPTTTASTSRRISGSSSGAPHHRGSPPAPARGLHFTVLGEAANQVSVETKGAHPQIAWSAATRPRNRIVHGYWVCRPRQARPWPVRRPRQPGRSEVRCRTKRAPSAGRRRSVRRLPTGPARPTTSGTRPSRNGRMLASECDQALLEQKQVCSGGDSG